MLGLLLVQIGKRARRNHRDMLLMHRQPQRAVERLGIRPVHDHVFAHFRGHELREVDDRNAPSLDRKAVAQSAGRKDHRVGLFRIDERRVHFVVQNHVHAVQLQLLFQVCLEVRQVLVRTFDVACEVQQPAKRAAFLVQRHFMAARRRDAGCLHAARASAYDHHFLGAFDGRKLVAFWAAFAEHALRHGVHAAIAPLRIVLVAADVAV